MEEKEYLEKYIIEKYQIYKNNNFDYFFEKCLNYNIRIGDYKKNIDSFVYSIFNNLQKNELFNVENLLFNNNELFYSIETLLKEKKDTNNTIIIEIPVFEENYEKILTIVLKYLTDNKIHFYIKMYKNIKNSLLQLHLFKINDYYNFISFYDSNREISDEVKSRVLPFLYQHNLLGIYTEIEPFSLKNMFITYLYEYYSKIEDENNISLSKFIDYIKNKYRLEKSINKKRMLFIIYRYIEIISNNEDIVELFKINMIMDIASFDDKDYSLKLDENQKIYFVNKFDNIEIRYGSEEYLNIVYSKYHNNVIKREQSDRYYYMFYNLYDGILSSNFKNIDDIHNLANDKMDNINKQLIIISSIYFAYKKMNFSLEYCYKILDYIL